MVKTRKEKGKEERAPMIAGHAELSLRQGRTMAAVADLANVPSPSVDWLNEGVDDVGEVTAELWVRWSEARHGGELA
jgi:hypothetical protein